MKPYSEWTKEEFYAAHQALWGWLAENPDKRKSAWPGWEWNGGLYEDCFNDCFACEYDDLMIGDRCCNCLIAWPNDKPCYASILKSWGRTYKAKLHRTASVTARKIANLPMRGEE